LRRATVSGPSSPSPAPRIEGGCRNQTCPRRCRQACESIRRHDAGWFLGRQRRHANPLNWPDWRGLKAPVAIPSLERTLRTTQEYGLSAARRRLKHRLAFCPWGPCAAVFKSLWAKKNGRFWLTMRRGEAYIQPIGAPSANGAIARLWSSSLEQWIGIR